MILTDGSPKKLPRMLAIGKCPREDQPETLKLEFFLLLSLRHNNSAGDPVDLDSRL